MEQLEKKKDTNEYIYLFLDNSSERTTDLLTTANVRINIDKQSFYPFVLFTKKSNQSSRIHFILHSEY
ncbi:hypothetical protein [uncultured Parabacteroides sp.]|uniref:hypothetical protein n=1 Tax=uncultured Parabacteroides sp. TaxID=512312 RepID=UPI002597225F|nr:hypothetical protein [uncultured Parabacteroides sp.]